MDGPKSNKSSDYIDDPETLFRFKRKAKKKSKSVGDDTKERHINPRALFDDPEEAMGDREQ